MTGKLINSETSTVQPSSAADCSIPGWVRNNRPCGECKHFVLGASDVLMGGCEKKLMAVPKNKPALSPEGDCCFEE